MQELDKGKEKRLSRTRWRKGGEKKRFKKGRRRGHVFHLLSSHLSSFCTLRTKMEEDGRSRRKGGERGCMKRNTFSPDLYIFSSQIFFLSLFSTVRLFPLSFLPFLSSLSTHLNLGCENTATSLAIFLSLPASLYTLK